MPTLLVRNMAKGPTVFSDLGENIQLEWQGAGDPDGRDLQRVPDKLMENVDFLRTIDRGLLKLEESSPELEAAIKEAQRIQQDRKEASQREVMDTIDREAETPLVTTEINEKGDIVAPTQEQAQEAQPHPEPQPQAEPGSTAQMDEHGNVIEEIPEPKVTMGPRERG